MLAVDHVTSHNIIKKKMLYVLIQSVIRDATHHNMNYYQPAPRSRVIKDMPVVL